MITKVGKAIKTILPFNSSVLRKLPVLLVHVSRHWIFSRYVYQGGEAITTILPLNVCVLRKFPVLLVHVPRHGRGSRYVYQGS